jgi:hypothetical protein
MLLFDRDLLAEIDACGTGFSPRISGVQLRLRKEVGPVAREQRREHRSTRSTVAAEWVRSLATVAGVLIQLLFRHCD